LQVLVTGARRGEKKVDAFNRTLNETSQGQQEVQPGLSRLTRRKGVSFRDTSTPNTSPVCQRRDGHWFGSVRRFTVAKKKAAKKGAKKAKKAKKKAKK
jgi:hypothetical protein